MGKAPSVQLSMAEEIAVTFTPAEDVFELVYARGTNVAVLRQPRTGYAMITVAADPNGPVIERYYELDMALDHAAELLGVTPQDLPVPEGAKVMGI